MKQTNNEFVSNVDKVYTPSNTLGLLSTNMLHKVFSVLSVQSDLQPLVSPLESSILQNCSADTERTMCKLNLSLCSTEASHQFFVKCRGQMTLIVFSCFALGTSVENVLTHSPWRTHRQEFAFVCVCESFSMLLWVYVCSPQATVNKMKY